MIKAFICAFVIGLLAGTSHAHSYRQGPLLIGHLHAQPGEGTGIYGPILNTGNIADQLTGADSDAAGRVTIMRDDTTLAPFIELPPGQPVSLRPHGWHLEFQNLKHTAASGDQLPLTLHFAKAGTVSVAVMIEPAAKE